MCVVNVFVVCVVCFGLFWFRVCFWWCLCVLLFCVACMCGFLFVRVCDLCAFVLRCVCVVWCDYVWWVRFVYVL